jgi:hypothetical protein
MSKQPIHILSSKAALDNNYVLVLTTNSVERDAVRAILKNDAPAEIGKDNMGARIGRLEGDFYIHLSGKSGAQEKQSIGSLCSWMTRPPMPTPRFVVVVGFAWGNPTLVNQGDVIVASRIWDISRQSIVSGVRQRRAVPVESSIGSLDDFIHRLSMPEAGWRVLAGTLASAEIYLADSDEHGEVISMLPEALGGEMEAFDLVRDLEIPWLLVKAVSDFGGHGTDRAIQEQAAQNAARVFPSILSLLIHEELLKPPKNDSITNSLTAAIIGQDIRISRPHGDRNDVVNAMNGHVRRLIDRLSIYSSDIDENGFFPETLAVAVVEIAQNAFLHGNATYVDCSFTETRITLTDDGKLYNPSGLCGERGGAQAWRELDALFLDTGHVRFNQIGKGALGNRYTFTLAMLNAEIRRARGECRVVRSTQGFGPIRLTHAIGCETLYYEATETFSFSKRIDDVTDLAELLASGKSLFIACRDQRQVQYYREALSAYAGSKLRIFVASRV